MTQAEELAWAAGLFEGEGCICVRPRTTPRDGVYVTLQLGMVDEDTVRSFFRVVAGGTINRYHPPSHRALGRKPTWMWRAGAVADVKRIGDILMPFMHARRRAALSAALENVRG